MSSLSLKSYAKVNLFLEVLWKRDDGYHEIESLIQKISLCDNVLLEDRPRSITILCPNKKINIPSNRNNLAYKAAKLLIERFNIKKGIFITINKKIPVGSGLGGGSSNAASVLKGLNQLWNIGLKNAELQELGAEIGSDVPFFINGKTALVKGRGVKIHTCFTMPKIWLVLAIPNISVSTKWAYGRLDRELTKNINSARLPRLKKLQVKDIVNNLFNRLEGVVFKEYPLIKAIKEKMIACGASGALMSGTGSAVFGIASSKDNAYKIAKKISNDPKLEVVCYVASGL
ncbi:4-(cytidine 5'-diphospho)-2-C-methyl-D-erythritol kinase [bacterium]|nr:4-(cytidine 5'-diphospho)-2-C-methyl-D-erythritol kinase [bacterium]